MSTIPQKELRNQVGEVLRRVEAGETLTITVAGREAAQLIPVQKHRWVSGAALAVVWNGPSPLGLDDDLATFGGAVTDPFEK